VLRSANGDMGNQQSGQGGGGPNGQGTGQNSGSNNQQRRKYEPPAPPTRVGKKQKKGRKGTETASRLPFVTPVSKCKLRHLRMERLKDWLLLEEELVTNESRLSQSRGGDSGPSEAGSATASSDPTGAEAADAAAAEASDQNQQQQSQQQAAERSKVDDLRGSPMMVGSLTEIVDDSHAIVSSAIGPEYYVNILSFVDKSELEPGCNILLHNKTLSVVGILQDDTDPMVSVMKVEKAPLESYADVGGLEDQVQEIKEAVELPLSRPELYEDIGIEPPKGVILYGAPGTGKTLLAKAVANQTSATFLRVVGSELIQKYLGDGPKLVRELFRAADEMAPSIVFIDEIDAVGSKRYDSQSGGEREIQRTMLELLNQMDGFDAQSEVKVVLATNKIESLDPALLRPGRVDRKIEFPTPDTKTKRRIFGIHTNRMTLAEDVKLEEFVMSKDELSGADIKALCTEAGLLALRERRMQVTHADFKAARDKVMHKKKEGVPESLYI